MGKMCNNSNFLFADIPLILMEECGATMVGGNGL